MKGNNDIIEKVLMKKLTSSQNLNVSLLLFAITLPLFLGGCLGAGTPTAADITGTWQVSTTGTGGTNGSYQLTSINNSVGGTSPTNESISGTITGSSITFQFTDSSGVTETYTGTVGSDETTMQGTFTTSSGGSGDWTAAETSSTAVTITGTWSLTNTPSNGTATAVGNLSLNQQTTTTFTGTFTGTSGGQFQITDGTITNSTTVTFSWIDATGATNSYTGTLNSDETQMAGTYSVGTTTGTWSALKTS
jgi:hypothetical protein